LEVIIRQEISGMKYTATILKDLLPLQIAGIYPTFDMLVVPSRTQRNWKEQFGRVLIEGMACGVPVIGSDSGAIPWVIGDAGRIFPEGDAAALANEIRLLAGSPELRRELGEKGRARVVEHFSTKVVVDDLLEFIRETAG
jgi:glycosyltransferase involved in cell wall biosynthesis